MSKNNMIRHIIPLALATLLFAAFQFPAAAEESPVACNLNDYGNDIPNGWLLWHSYSEYSALDSKLYLRTPDGTTETISGDFIHAMNGSFGPSPELLTFMAIDQTADEWDIYLSDHGQIVNLTENSGFRNEDPKFSPDGNSIVFKRGHWDNNVDGFVYDLALLDVNTKEITMLTDDPAEEAMPCFSSDGRYIYYASYTESIGSICRFDIISHESLTIYSEENVTAYYPVISGENLYFTKWYSADNRCDQIMCYDGISISSLPFDSAYYDSSDACPLSGGKMIFSSTMNGDYDLFYYDGSNILPLSALNTDNNELGASFYSYDKYYESFFVNGDVNADGELTVADLLLFQRWLMDAPDSELNSPCSANMYNDDKLDLFDLILMRRALLE